MTGVVAGLAVPETELHKGVCAYVEAYCRASDAARTAAGGRLTYGVGGPSWAPAWPRELTPAWAARVMPDDGDGLTWYITIDGPEVGGVFVSQTINVDLQKLDGTSLTDPIDPAVVVIEVEPLCITDGGKMNEFLLDLEQARAHTRGMIAAGRLLAQLLEGPREVR